MAGSPYTTSLLTVADLIAEGSDPRVRDLRIAEALEMANPYKIRELIDANREELLGYGEVSPRRGETSIRGGRPGVEYWLNEPQALLICMFSRTPKAAEVRKALIEIFMAYRQGKTVHVRQHHRAAPRAKAQDMPAMLEPGSDFARDLLSIVLSANLAVAKDQAPDFGQALECALEAAIARKADPGRKGPVPLLDWNWRRNDRAEAAIQSAPPARLVRH